jgi:hypothetical protein
VTLAIADYVMDERAGFARVRFSPSCDDDLLADASRTLLTSQWVNLRPDTSREENVICFSSGFGDGTYPSFGFDSNGQVC